MQAVFTGEQLSFDDSQSIISFIKQTVSLYPDNLALIFQGERLSYQDLWQEVRKCVAYLKEKGIKQGDPILFLVEPGISLIVYFLATLWIGALYVPLDSACPREKILEVTDAVSPVFVLSSYDLSVESITIEICNVVTNDLSIYNPVGENYEAELGSLPAYILFTSGSTGRPKGVVVSHSSVNNHMLWMKTQFDYLPEDVVLFKTPIYFDPSIWEMLLPFYVGASVVIAPKDSHINVELLRGLVRDYGVTDIQFVPSILYRWLSLDAITELTALKRVFSGGESLYQKIKIKFFGVFPEKVRLINLYGPTEATIDSLYHEVFRTDDFSSDIIGAPIANTSVFVLDANDMPCITGELCLAGKCLSLGYLGGVSASGFKKIPSVTEDRLYRTGDYVRVEGQELVFLGRGDCVCKLNGARVDLDALKELLEQEENIDRVFFNICKDENFHEYLEAWIVPVNLESSIREHVLYSKLLNKFPHYMVPKVFYLVESYKLLPNGKIDYKSFVKKEVKGLYSNEGRHYDALVKAWSAIFKQDIDYTGDPNFYACGGDSLAMVNLVSHLSVVYNQRIDVYSFMHCSTFSRQIDYLKHLNDIKNNRDSFVWKISSSKSSRITLVLVHPIGGTASWYMPFTDIFSDKLTCYVVNDPGVWQGLEKYRFESIYDMASCYLQELMRLGLSGPVVFGGASFGTTVACELAKLYSKLGEIEGLISLDGWGVYPEGLNDDRYFRASMKRQQEAWSREFIPGANVLDLEQLYAVQWQRLGLLSSYQPSMIDWPFVLFKAKKLEYVFEEINAPLNYWDKFCSKLQCIEVNGSHETMFRSQNGRDLAVKIMDVVDTFVLKSVAEL